MNTLDIILVVIAVASLLYGLLKGFIVEIFSLVAVVAGFLCANAGYDSLAPIFREKISILFLTEVLFDPFAAGIWIS